MQESIQLVIDSFAVPVERGWVYPATQYRRHVFGLLLGFILALMRLSPIWPVRWLARFYISIFFVVRRSSHNCLRSITACRSLVSN